MSEDFRFLASWLTRLSPLSENDPAWDDLVRIASSQRLAGLVLESPACRSAPDRVSSALRAGAAQVAGHNLHALCELARVARAFEEAGIPLMALKGAALNLTVYSRRDLRPMSDLDLLVAPQDALRAVARLQSIGYAAGASLIRDDFFPAHHYEREMILAGSRPVRVDLHAQPWRPMHLAQIVTRDSFWAGAVRVPIHDTSILIPGPETMFVHLAAHAAFHACSRLIWLYDLKRVSEHYAAVLDWDGVVDSVREWHLSLAVRNAIDEAEKLFGQVCPPRVARQLSAAQSHWRDRLTLWHTPRDASTPLLHVACNTLCLRGIRPSAAYLAAMLLPSREHLAESYTYRHAGWTWCAQGLRALRAFGRTLAMPKALLRSSFHWSRVQGAYP